MGFLIQWLLCSVAFAVWIVPINQPNQTVRILQILVSGVLVAIAISLVPSGLARIN